MSLSFYDSALKLIDIAFEEAIKHRRYLHAHPELSGNEKNTSSYIIQTLKNYGINNIQIYSNYGVSALVEGQEKNFVIGLRAEMDALPIEEATKLEFSSTTPGVMHACGHDLHMAILLGFSYICGQLKEKLPISIKFIYQPSEETLPGGAKQMIDAGVLTNPDVTHMLAFHAFPELPVGQIGLHPGMYMASNDEIFITLTGQGGHAAMPHLLNDPVLCAAQLVTTLYQIINRRSVPDIPTILSFGKIIANGRTNVIPDKVELEGTLRTFDENWRIKAHSIIKNTTDIISQIYDVESNLQIINGYPVLVNDEKLTISIKQLTADLLGSDSVQIIPIRTTADDFAYFTQIIPSCFIRLGVSSLDKSSENLHTPLFSPDEKSITTALIILIKITESLHNLL